MLLPLIEIPMALSSTVFLHQHLAQVVAICLLIQPPNLITYFPRAALYPEGALHGYPADVVVRARPSVSRLSPVRRPACSTSPRWKSSASFTVKPIATLQGLQPAGFQAATHQVAFPLVTFAEGVRCVPVPAVHPAAEAA